MAIEKIKILGAVLELPAKQHCQSSPFTSEVGTNGLNWQCYLAGSSKTAPRILIFSIVIGANYSFDIKSGFSIAPAFSLYNNFDIASVYTTHTYYRSSIIFWVGWCKNALFWLSKDLWLQRSLAYSHRGMCRSSYYVLLPRNTTS